MTTYPRRRFPSWWSIPALIAAGLIAAPTWAAVDQWSALNPPVSGDITALAVDPAAPLTIFVATLDGQVHKSTNGGGAWVSFDPGSSGSGFTPHLFTVAVHPRDTATIAVGADFGRIYTSEDGGGTWRERRVDESPGTSQTIDAFAFVPAHGLEAIAGTSNGIWTNTSSSPGHWDHDTSIPSNCRTILSVAVDPQDPDVRYAGSTCGLFKTTGGRTGQWTRIGAPFLSAPVRVIAIDPISPDNVYAGTDGSGVFKVQNGGLGVTNISTNNGITGPVIHGLAIHRQFPNVIYAATSSQGIFKGSTAGTGRWLAFNAGLPAMPWLAIGVGALGNPGIVYAASAGNAYGIEQSSVLPPPADLDLSARPTREQPKGVFNYTINVTNRGPNSVEYVKVNIEASRSSGILGRSLNPPLKDRIQYLRFGGGACRQQSTNCARGLLAGGASATMTFSVKSSTTRPFRFQIPVDVTGLSTIPGNLWGVADPNPNNNTTRIQLPVP